MRLRPNFTHNQKSLALKLSALSFAVLLPLKGMAFSPFVVQDIRVTGLQSAEPGMVFSYLPVGVGGTFTEAQATDTVQRLYATGLFDDVNITTHNRIVNIQVVERPIITSVIYEGMNAFNDKQLNSSLLEVGFGEGRPLDPALLDRAKDEIRSQYILKGHYGASIDHILTPLPGNRVGISFQVQEGSRARIRDINFVGNDTFSSSTLRKEMVQTTPGYMTWFTGSHRFTREGLERDTQNIRDFYLNRGYLDFHISQPQVSLSTDRKDISLNFTVDEGKPYTIRKQQLAGDLLGLNEELRQLIVQREGQVFDNSRAQETVRRIQLRLGELGYALADVNVHPITDPETQQVDVTYFVSPGKRIYVRRINIGGNVRTRDQVIRREMRQQESAWYDEARLSTSRDRIDRLGYFNTVDITQVPVAGTDDQVDINVDVKEKPTGLINLGVGYGSTDKLSFMAGVSQDNIFGSGTDLSLQINTGRYNRAAILSHTDPYFTRSGISRTTSLYFRENRPYSDYVYDQDERTYRIRTYGFGMNFGVPISENDRIFLGATFEQNRITLPDRSINNIVIPEAYREFVKHYGEKSNVFLLNAGWTKDTRDSALAPTRGYRTSLDAVVGVGDLNYWITSASGQYYLPLGKSFTLAFNAAVDYGRSFNKNKPFPVIKNMYAGGIGSVRGYEGASLGSRDPVSGDYLGGSSRVLANVQLYLPFPGTNQDRTLRWFVFADAGKVTTTGSTTCYTGSSRYGGVVEDPCGWRYSAGVGLSWQSPLGPLELSYAKPIKSKQGDEKQQFQFQIGTSF
ncbi:MULTISPECIES: outer membrane protein assembly factor BamA [Oligella]|uniref:Outer membrane protein assembly factor BamA n=1 Tax=Oligella urethralis DNF00040 TaxID=1401065 RepID=A0A096AH26_9BURK|nr:MULTISPECIES: outer membrane protein assembly factor BamA [Oligella]KGF30012.1 membrane protein [Oligella urethralis DNF00040]MDK6202019.1 outer membrane protein assembly factor BamA [Oligella urethralis]OFS84642.1 outer membrane protein assembly factor BamA [Oligella sp. HMSC05A10]OFV47912.1 outer membrane protein assembly factor BamA [Oligella sp. HMSC09E12]WOS37509.1 Outer membrane protein assembly factor BamA [Oligella urethralis]